MKMQSWIALFWMILILLALCLMACTHEKEVDVEGARAKLRAGPEVEDTVIGGPEDDWADEEAFPEGDWEDLDENYDGSNEEDDENNGQEDVLQEAGGVLETVIQEPKRKLDLAKS